MARRTVEVQRELNTTKILERSIRLMLPKTVQGRNQFRALHVFIVSEHPYAAQKPEALSFNKGESK